MDGRTKSDHDDESERASPCRLRLFDKKVSRWLLGDYEEDYVRRNGAWLFKKIDYLMNYNVAFDQSWADSAVVRALAMDLVGTALRNPINRAILQRLPLLGAPQCWLVAGCIYQAAWNERAGPRAAERHQGLRHLLFR